MILLLLFLFGCALPEIKNNCEPVEMPTDQTSTYEDGEYTGYLDQSCLMVDDAGEVDGEACCPPTHHFVEIITKEGGDEALCECDYVPVDRWWEYSG